MSCYGVLSFDKLVLVNYRRNFQPGGTFFFTLVTLNRHRLFKNDAAYALFQQVVQEIKAERPFRMVAWVVLHDHLHMMWALPPGDADYSGRWSKIKSQFTRRWLEQGGREQSVSIGKRRDGRRGIWQPKFYEHTIRDEDDYIDHVEYTHYNPVKHGYVKHPKDWPRSSFHEYVRRGWYPRNWCCGPDTTPARQPDVLPYDPYD